MGAHGTSPHHTHKSLEALMFKSLICDVDSGANLAVRRTLPSGFVVRLFHVRT